MFDLFPYVLFLPFGPMFYFCFVARAKAHLRYIKIMLGFIFVWFYSSRAAHPARPQLLRTFACSPVMVADCGSIVATENLESKNNGSRQRRKENLKEEIIKNRSNIVQNPSKSLLKLTKKRPQTDENASLKCFWRQIAPRTPSGLAIFFSKSGGK